MRSRFFLGLGLLLALLGPACTPTPPPYWAEGGSQLQLPNATWTRHRGSPFVISSDGRVTRGSRVVFLLDTAGRVFDEDHEPIAVLDPDGYLVGTNAERLGRVGYRNAAPPWSPVAWLRVSGSGTLMLFDGTSRPIHGGDWQGCDGPSVRVCTLVSHLVVLEAVKRQLVDAPYHPGRFGAGVGVWY